MKCIGKINLLCAKASVMFFYYVVVKDVCGLLLYIQCVTNGEKHKFPIEAGNILPFKLSMEQNVFHHYHQNIGTQ